MRSIVLWLSVLLICVTAIQCDGEGESPVSSVDDDNDDDDDNNNDDNDGDDDNNDSSGDSDSNSDSEVDSDSDGDSDSDSDTDGDSDSDSDSDGGFSPTPGTQAEVDRTEPCNPEEDVAPQYAPQDGQTVRYCFPNYNIWVPLECGNNPWDLPGECDQFGCSSSVCLTGEAGKWVSGGGSDGVCACFNLCTSQQDGARCGAANERPCIAIDNAEGNQVFICGAEI
jgi:hypothetical protein